MLKVTLANGDTVAVTDPDADAADPLAEVTESGALIVFSFRGSLAPAAGWNRGEWKSFTNGNLVIQEPETYSVVLTGAGSDAQKIQGIKLVREYARASLRDAKFAIDDVCSGKPYPVLTGLNKAQAERVLKTFTDYGFVGNIQ